MGCKCGKSGIVREMARLATSQPSAQGGYELAGYPNCEQLYKGKLEGQAVYVVARLSENERIFRFTKLAEASAYAKEVNGPIESLPASGICHDAVEDVYA